MRKTMTMFVRTFSIIAAATAFTLARGDDVGNMNDAPRPLHRKPKVHIMPPQISIEVRQAQDQTLEPLSDDPQGEPYLGLVTGPITEQLRAQLGIPQGMGLVVEGVAPDGPAGRAGVKEFDVIRKFDDQIVCTDEQLAALVKASANKEVALTLTRAAKDLLIKVTIEELEMAENGSATADIDALADLPSGVASLVAEVLPAEAFPGLLDDDARATIQRRVEEALAQSGIGKGNGKALARVFQIYPGSRSQSIVIHSDDRGTVEIREVDGKRTVTIKDPEGKQVYAGPLNDDADREKIPEEFRGMVDEVDSEAAARSATP